MRYWMGFAVAAVIITSTPLCHAGMEGRIDRFVQSEMERQRMPGVALGVVKDGDVLVAKGYGLADVEQHVAVTPDTIFLAASITKQFTAAAVMLLVQDGVLALDASIAKYLPRAPAAWKPITVRHLLTHTSGIADYDEDDSICAAAGLIPTASAGSSTRSPASRSAGTAGTGAATGTAWRSFPRTA